jgi:hypothetical protein
MSHGDATTVYLFGFGTYQGREVPTSARGWVAEACVEVGIESPKIVLDSGEVVWGCECWWSNETNVREIIGDREVVLVSIEARRAEVEAATAREDEEFEDEGGDDA